MTRRKRAIEILTKYQAALTDRLADLVIDQEEQLMDEAAGPDLGFTNELYELAEKLRAVSVTLSVMPPETKQPESFQDPKSVVVVTSLPQITISHFLALVDANDVERAAGALSHIFNLQLHRAARCTDHFVRKLETDNDTMNKVYLLAQSLQTSMNQTLALMNDLFGLLPFEAQQVVQHLKSSR